MRRTDYPGSPTRNERSPTQKAEAKPKTFVKAVRTATYKRQMDEKRQIAALSRDEEYLGAPPLHEDLREARLVIPGEHRLPLGLDNDAAFDNIRISSKIWITRVEPHVFDIHSRSMTGLRTGMDGINAILHDMRLTNDVPLVRYFVQVPTKVKGDSLVKFKSESRPQVVESSTVSQTSSSKALDSLMIRLGTRIQPAAESLLALSQDLKMRVNFGKLYVRDVKRGTGEHLNYAELEDTLSPYSTRGGADLNVKFADPRMAERLVQHLEDISTGFCSDLAAVTRTCSMIVKSQGSELVAEVVGLGQSKPQLGGARSMQLEDWDRLNWTVVAPDMKFDWNLTVKGSKDEREIPASFGAILQTTKLKYQGEENNASLTIPNVGFEKFDSSGSVVQTVFLKSSVVIPFKDTPYLVEISRISTYKDGKTTKKPALSWCIEVYGAHWDDAINCVNATDGERKDWGEDLRIMWPGRYKTLEERFGAFLKAVLDIQSFLDAFNTKAPGN